MRTNAAEQHVAASNALRANFPRHERRRVSIRAGSAPRPTVLASRSPAPTPLGVLPDLIHLQAAVLLAPTVVCLLDNLHFLARQRQRLPVSYAYLNLSQTDFCSADVGSIEESTTAHHARLLDG